MEKAGCKPDVSPTCQCLKACRRNSYRKMMQSVVFIWCRYGWYDLWLGHSIRSKAGKTAFAFQEAPAKKWSGCGLWKCGNPLCSKHRDAEMLPLTSERQSCREGKQIGRYNENLVGKNKRNFLLRVQLMSLFLIYWGSTVLCSVLGRAGMLLWIYQRKF